MTAFIVERAFGGVTSGTPEDKYGIRGSNSKSKLPCKQTEIRCGVFVLHLKQHFLKVTKSL